MFAFSLNVLLLFITIEWINCELKMTILHTNDMHSHLLETSRSTGPCKPPEPCYGGFARVAYQTKLLKSQIPNTLHLNAGDTYQGTPFYAILKYKVLLEVMDHMGIDVMSLGNHEFDDGVAGLTPYLQQIRIPVVTCNLDMTREPSLTNHTVLKPWHMLVVDNVKIAVIGYLTPDTSFISSPGKVIILDEIEMIKKYAKEAKEVGAQLIIALGHSGFLRDKEIAKEVSDVDVVVGGHTDTFLYHGTPPDTDVPVDDYPVMIEQPSGKKVPVVQAFKHTKYLGKLDLVWNDNLKLISAKGNPILLDSKIPKNEEVEKIVQERGLELSATLQQKIGETSVNLDGQCRRKECNLGNLITDAFSEYVIKLSGNYEWDYDPIVLYIGGGVRSSIEQTDNITIGDLLTVLPFDNQLARIKMKGSTLLKALHRSIERYDLTGSIGYGEFLQVSGLKVVYAQDDKNKLNVEKASVKCRKCAEPKYEDIDPNKEYTVVTTLFVVEGGDGYTMFKDESKTEQIFEENDLNIVRQYIQRMSPVHPVEEGRITIKLSSMPAMIKGSANWIYSNFYLLLTSLLLVYIK